MTKNHQLDHEFKVIVNLDFDSYVSTYNGNEEQFVDFVMSKIGPRISSGQLLGKGGRLPGGNYNTSSKIDYVLNILRVYRKQGYSVRYIAEVLNVYIRRIKHRFSPYDVVMGLDKIRATEDLGSGDKRTPGPISRITKLAYLTSPRTSVVNDVIKPSVSNSVNEDVKVSTSTIIDTVVKKPNELYPVDLSDLVSLLGSRFDLYPTFGTKVARVEDILDGSIKSKHITLVKKLGHSCDGLTGELNFTELVDFVDKLPYQSGVSKSGVKIGEKFDSSFLRNEIEKLMNDNFSDLYWGRFVDNGLWHEVISRIQYATDSGLLPSSDIASVNKLNPVGMIMLQRLISGFGDILCLALGNLPSWVDAGVNDLYPKYDLDLGGKKLSGVNLQKPNVGISSGIVATAWLKQNVSRGREFIKSFFRGELPNGLNLQRNVYKLVGTDKFNYVGAMMFASAKLEVSSVSSWDKTLESLLALNNLIPLCTQQVTSLAMPSHVMDTSDTKQGFVSYNVGITQFAQAFASASSLQYNHNKENEFNSVSMNLTSLPNTDYGDNVFKSDFTSLESNLSNLTLDKKVDYQDLLQCDLSALSGYLRIADLRCASTHFFKPIQVGKQILSLPGTSCVNLLPLVTLKSDEFIISGSSFTTQTEDVYLKLLSKLDYMVSDIYLKKASAPFKPNQQLEMGIPFYGPFSAKSNLSNTSEFMQNLKFGVQNIFKFNMIYTEWRKLYLTNANYDFNQFGFPIDIADSHILSPVFNSGI